MDTPDIDTVIHSIVAMREKRKAAEAEAQARQAALMAFMIENNVFETTADGKLRYESEGFNISIRNGYEMRRFHLTAEPGLLDSIKEAPSRPKNHTAHEILLMASGLNKSLIELMERHGKLNADQIAALYSIEPEVRSKVIVTATGAHNADPVNDLLGDD